MFDFLRNFDLDRNSFLVGFILGILFWIFVGFLRPIFKRAWAYLLLMIDQSRSLASRGIDVHLANDTLQRLQKTHLAASLFSLDEVRLEPRFLAPKPSQTPNSEPVIQDITRQTIPYNPDAPEILGAYRAPTASLAEMLASGANLVIIGKAGSGKSFALQDLACQISRKELSVGDLVNLVPLYIRALDLNPALPEEKTHLGEIIEVYSQYSSSRTNRQLPGYLENAFSIGRVLLLIDDLDVLPPAEFDPYVDFLKQLLRKYPGIQVVTTSSTSYYGDLTLLGFVPVSISPWDAIQRSNFVHRWSELWTRYIRSDLWSGENGDNAAGVEDRPEPVDPLFIEGMLLNNIGSYTPLEFTALTWSAFAGDMLGNNPAEGLEAYVRRLTLDIPNGVEALEQLGATLISRQTASIDRREVDSYDPDEPQDPGADSETTSDPDQAFVHDATEHVSVKRSLSKLLSSGLLAVRSKDRVVFQHPPLLAYLASAGLAKIGSASAVTRDIRWETNISALGYLSRVTDPSSTAVPIINSSRPPLQNELFGLSGELKVSPKGQVWRTTSLRKLAQMIQDDTLPLVLRTRAMTALATSGEPDVARLFRPLISADDQFTRQLATLASGYIRDVEAVKLLNERLYDPSPSVQRSACLALVAIGDEESLEFVATALLHGDDDLRRAAAEAFANHPEEGYPLLKDGATLDDLLVRRATVFGLYRIREPWATDLLTQMHLEDEQWVVRAAATQAVEELQRPRAPIPAQNTPLHDLPWLIEFASERGMGVTTGKPALDMLKLALKEGTPEQQIAALSRLSEAIDNETLDLAYGLFNSNDIEIQQAAYLALWDLSRGGFDLPAP